jgi:flagellar hook-associated protein 1 FlgK
VSTFSGLGTALSSLIAQRQALDVSAQNVANAKTDGYTRQRVNLSSVEAVSVPSMFSTSNGIGQGVQSSGTVRLGDVFLDAKVRAAASTAGQLAVRGDAYTALERSLGEPAKTGLGGQLSDLWAGFADLANGANREGARAVVLERGDAVATRLHTLYTDAATQWQQARSTTSALVDRVNAAASSVADLNERILAIESSGGTAHELADQRDSLVTELSSLVGASSRVRDNGQVDVLVGGNLLVTGKRVSELALTGADAFSQATAGTAVQVVWADFPTQSAGLEGGKVAGLLSVLAPPDQGGLLTGAAQEYDKVAQALHDQVNALHSTARREDGTPGGDFFTVTAGQPAALSLKVALTQSSQVAAGEDGKGPYDGSVATAIAQLGSANGGPDAMWRAVVTDIGVKTASATSRATVANVGLVSAENQQLANASVDIDEETVNMLAHQRAYEGAARVLTAIDEMLDTLINRTGIVGR